MFRVKIPRSALAFPVAIVMLFAVGYPADVGAIEKERCSPLYDLNPSNFSNPTKIDNKWLPYKPGTQFVSKGTSNRGDGVEKHELIFTVTDLTKKIAGIESVVVSIQDISDGELVEDELSFFAQDNDGNVWLLGEFPAEYEDGKFSDAASAFIVGQGDAKAGTPMVANPKVGGPVYAQASIPSIEFLDCAKVRKFIEKICNGSDCYKDVMVIEEVNPYDKEGGYKLKYHASGIGVVKVGAEQDKENEQLQMVKRVMLGKEEMAKVHKRVMELEKLAYKVNKSYKATKPIQMP